MATFTVHVPPGIADPVARAEKTAFVRDGFSFRAFLLGPVYLAYHRLWGATLVWLVAAALATGRARALARPAPAGGGLYLGGATLTGLEAGQARQAAYRRRGYVGAAVLAGVDRNGAERRFYDAEAAGRLPPLAPPPRDALPRPEPVIGLFPEPGGRR